MNPKQILKDSISRQFESYVTEHYGQYGFDPYGWEPDMWDASDALLDAKFDNNKYGDQWYEFITELVAEIDLDDIKERVMEEHNYHETRSMDYAGRKEPVVDMSSLSMRIVNG